MSNNSRRDPRPQDWERNFPKEETLEKKFREWAPKSRRRRTCRQAVIPRFLELWDMFRSTERLRQSVKPYLRSAEEDYMESAKGLAQVFGIEDADAFSCKYRQLIQADPANTDALFPPPSRRQRKNRKKNDISGLFHGII